MPSPFPGMDPYLEAPAIWPDFHHRFAADLSAVLNRSLPRPYYAQLEMRTELGIATVDRVEEEHRTIIPDVQIARGGDRSGGIAVLEAAPARVVSSGLQIKRQPAPATRQFFVEIRDSKRNHALVTLIEILSPSNKRPGPDRKVYIAKQGEILASQANLIEIDLHRSGRRIAPNRFLLSTFSNLEPSAYLVLISRYWQRREPSLGYVAYPFSLRMWLPCIPVPLHPNVPEIALDLQAAFRQTFDGGPYLRGALNYTLPPEPPLSPSESKWANDLLRARGFLAHTSD